MVEKAVLVPVFLLATIVFMYLNTAAGAAVDPLVERLLAWAARLSRERRSASAVGVGDLRAGRVSASRSRAHAALPRCAPPLGLDLRDGGRPRRLAACPRSAIRTSRARASVGSGVRRT